MDTIMEYLSSHPAILTALVIFAVIIILYFIFKQFVKLALVLLLIVLAAAGYYYFQDPNTISGKFKESVNTMKSGINDINEKRKTIYTDTKELFKEGKEMPGEVGKMIKDSNKAAEKEFKK